MLSSSVQALGPFGVIVDSAADWFAEKFDLLRIEITKTILEVALPTVQDIKSQGVMVGLGSTYGLATRLMNVVAIAVGLFVVLTIRRRHGDTISRLATSMLWIAIFAAALFPVFGILTQLARAVALGVINVASGSEVSDVNEVVELVKDLALPLDSGGKLVVSAGGVVLGLVALLNSYAYYYTVIVIVIIYPLVVALRPLHKWIDVMFHGLNSLFVVCLLTPSIMAAGLMFPFWVRNAPLGDTATAQGVTTIIGGLIAAILPIVLAWAIFRMSREVFGKVESDVSGAVDVNSMPETSSSEMAKSTDDAHASPIGAFAKTAGLGALTGDLGNSRDFWGDVRKIGVEAASVAAAAGTGGVSTTVAAALQTVDTTLDKEHRKREERNRANTPPPPQVHAAPTQRKV